MGRARKAFVFVLVLLAFSGLFDLGLWQLHRRAWKHDLITRVEQRIHAAPTDAPGPEIWSNVNDADDSYRRVRLRGVFLQGLETRVETTTVEGQGYWVLTPLRTDQGFVVLVNRGFIPRVFSANIDPPEEEITVTGLLRMTEPGGRFLRPNQPAQNRWYSRDIAAIAATHSLSPVAPYFVDAEETPASGWPRGDMTVTRFNDNHLVYAMTWFGLAAMLALWTIRALI